ncbi:MAG: hypothetical protein ABSG86_12705 [Thermoguttaceae bacterium]|jgi:hypothetical protein
MDAISATQILASLTPEKKARMVAMLCHDLTVVARDTYGEGMDVKAPARLRELNEIEHRMTGFLVRILKGDDSRAPDDAIAGVFFADREDKRLEGILEFAFARVSRTFQEPVPLPEIPDGDAR